MNSIYRKKNPIFYYYFSDFYYFIILLLFFMDRWNFDTWHGVLKRRLFEFSTRGRRQKLPKYPFCQISHFCSKSPPECPETLFRYRKNYQNTLCVGTTKITKIPFLPNFTVLLQITSRMSWNFIYLQNNTKHIKIFTKLKKLYKILS